jgi:retron-type reverse transcriptase
MLEGQTQKVHSLVDKVYSRKNLKLAWELVRANRGASGPDGVSIGAFEADLDANWNDFIRSFETIPISRGPVEIPKRGAPGKTRPLGIPSVYDRVCQHALLNRLAPIFERVFDPSGFGYRKGRKTADALSKIWREVEAGNEWIVDADLKDYFGSVDHEKLATLVGKQIADGRVLRLIQQMLKAGYERRVINLRLHWEPRRGSGRYKAPPVRRTYIPKAAVRHGETVNPSRNRKSGSGNPSLTARRAQAQLRGFDV